MLGVDGILCGCTDGNPCVLALDYSCSSCNMANEGMKLVADSKLMPEPPVAPAPAIQPTQCPHGYLSSTDCPTCNPPVAPHEPNTTCEECKAKFWSQGGHARFCSSDCKDNHEKKLAAKYAKPATVPFNGLAAFLEGEPSGA